jgi:hypothetical protein
MRRPGPPISCNASGAYLRSAGPASSSDIERRTRRRWSPLGTRVCLPFQSAISPQTSRKQCAQLRERTPETEQPSHFQPPADTTRHPVRTPWRFKSYHPHSHFGPELSSEQAATRGATSCTRLRRACERLSEGGDSPGRAPTYLCPFFLAPNVLFSRTSKRVRSWPSEKTSRCRCQ